MKITKIFLGALLLLNYSLGAQYIPQISAPSPNATSISKFAESPVSYYRGSAQVNIPLFDIKTEDIPLNISLQYDTKGIRVAEIASSVGAGWSLAAGGLITRQVRHRPDENNFGYLQYTYNTNFENDPALRQQLYNEQAGNSSSDTSIDEDPDLYFINFLGRTAKFIIDNTTKKAVSQSIDDLKIELIYQSGGFIIDKIVITDEMGNMYYFGNDIAGANPTYDVVTSVSSGLITGTPQNKENGYRTAWHLKEVKTQKNSYRFNYIPEQVTTYGKTDVKTGDNVGLISLTTTKTTQQVLQNILFPLGTLALNYNNLEREDLQGGRALSNIVLKDKRGSQIKKIDFVQSYRPGDLSHTNIHPTILSKDEKSDKRLFLNQINEISRSENVISFYKFEYNSKELPNRHSNSIDYWGYYNGKPNKMNIFTDISDRDVYGAYTEAGILTKIIYPTGGSENFFYEDNNVLIPNHLSSIMATSPSQSVYDVKSTAVFKGSNYFVLNNGSTTLGRYVKEFSIQSSYDNKITFNAMLGAGCTAVETTDCKTKVRLYNIQTGAAYIITHGQNNIANPPIQNGNYRIEVSNPNFTLSDSENFETNSFSVSLNWKERKDDVSSNSFVGGGRRVLKIETNESGKILTRSFKYTLDNGTTSGRLLGVPDYMYVIKKYGNISLVAGQLSSKIQPMSSFNNAGQVGYSQVTESFSSGVGTLLWSKKYSFTNYADGGEYYKFPYHISDDLSWARGLNLKTISYNAEGIIVETLENKYKFSGEDFSPYRFYTMYDGTLATNAPMTELTSSPPALAPSGYLLTHHLKSVPIYKWGKYLNDPSDPFSQSSNIYRTSFFYGGMIQNYQKIKTEYVNGVPTQTTYIDTTNGSLSHHQITSQKAMSPDGSLTEINYQYAHEENNADMIAANMLGISLQKEVKENGKTISKTKAVYAKNTSTNNLILPVAIQKFDHDNSNSVNTNIEYQQYDIKGNILQFVIKGNAKNIPTSIIWGYNDMLPIAKIEGATYQQVVSLAADIIAKSNADVDTGTEKELITALDTFRNQNTLKDYSITTYTYDPLIGITTVTPSTGLREFYTYDTAGRLQSVVDANGNILKEMNYNYKH